MISPRDLKRHIIRPTLEYIRLSSPAAVNLLLGTAITEPNIGGVTHLVQRGGGPAVSPWQIEPATRFDVYNNFLIYRPSLAALVRNLVASRPSDLDEQIKGNLWYAAAIARLVYYRDPQPLPAAGDLAALGEYWKRVYNTAAGAGTVGHWLDQVEPWRSVFLSDD